MQRDTQIGRPENLLSLNVSALAFSAIMWCGSQEQFAGVLAEDVKEGLDIGMEASQLHQLDRIRQSPSLTFLARQAQKGTTILIPAGVGHGQVIECAYLAHDAVYQPTDVINEVIVRRITHLRLAARNVYLQRAAVGLRLSIFLTHCIRRRLSARSSRRAIVSGEF